MMQKIAIDPFDKNLSRTNQISLFARKLNENAFYIADWKWRNKKGGGGGGEIRQASASFCGFTILAWMRFMLNPTFHQLGKKQNTFRTGKNTQLFLHRFFA